MLLNRTIFTKLLFSLFFTIILSVGFAKSAYSAVCNCECKVSYCWLCEPPGDVGWCDWDVCDTCDTCGPNPGGDSCTNCSSCGSGGCFTADTKIATPSGEIEIEKIKKGDVVKSFDPETGEIKEATVEATHKRQVQGYYILKTESGKEIKVTGEHPILVLDENGQKVWRKVEDIKEGDTSFVLDESGNVVEKTDEVPDLSGYVGLKIIGKEIFEENGKEYVLLKFDNGKEVKLLAGTELPIKNGRIIFDPQPPSSQKTSNTFNFLTQFVRGIWEKVRGVVK